MNYRESSSPATTWRRAYHVAVDNRLGHQPRVEFHEEDVISADSQTVSKPVGTVSVEFDPSGTIEVLDPTTGKSTGETMPHAVVYAVLYSLYMQAAANRDATPAFKL